MDALRGTLLAYDRRTEDHVQEGHRSVTDSAASPVELGGLALNPDALGPPVGRALGESRVEVTGWRAERLRAGAGNPTSAGVYRLAGEARTANGAVRAWSMVLKVFQSPASVSCRPRAGWRAA
jgi:hypothetical protein